MTAVAYAVAGLYTRDSLSLIPTILPSLVIGVPIGAVLIRRVRSEIFRRVCMSFDAWIVSFGTSTLLRDLGLVTSAAAYFFVVGVVILDAWLLYRFFVAREHLPPERQEVLT